MSLTHTPTHPPYGRTHTHTHNGRAATAVRRVRFSCWTQWTWKTCWRRRWLKTLGVASSNLITSRSPTEDNGRQGEPDTPARLAKLSQTIKELRRQIGAEIEAQTGATKAKRPDNKASAAGTSPGRETPHSTEVEGGAGAQDGTAESKEYPEKKGSNPNEATQGDTEMAERGPQVSGEK